MKRISPRTALAASRSLKSRRGDSLEVRAGELRWQKIRASWFNPRDGTSQAVGTFERGDRTFDPPGEPARGNDWVLVLEDSARQFQRP